MESKHAKQLRDNGRERETEYIRQKWEIIIIMHYCSQNELKAIYYHLLLPVIVSLQIPFVVVVNITNRFDMTIDWKWWITLFSLIAIVNLHDHSNIVAFMLPKHWCWNTHSFSVTLVFLYPLLIYQSTFSCMKDYSKNYSNKHIGWSQLIFQSILV